METTSSPIRFASLIADPNQYIAEMFQLHPDAKHDEASGEIHIKNPIIDSSFKYRKMEEGLFLFSFSSYSPVDAEYEFIPNPESSYFTLVFYFTLERSKNPIYIKSQDTFYSSDQISIFFNGGMNAEIFIKAKQNAFGLRIDMHLDWLKQNMNIRNLKSGTTLQQILSFNKMGYINLDCLSYETLVKGTIASFDEKHSVFAHLNLKKNALELVAKYLSEIPDEETRKNKDGSGKYYTGELDKALNYLGKNIKKDFPGNSYLSTLCGISESAFSKKFKLGFNVSPSNYFKTIKLKEALRLLQLGKSVKDVSFQVGYQNTSAFVRSFKHQYGKSPASFVKNKTNSIKNIS